MRKKLFYAVFILLVLIATNTNGADGESRFHEGTYVQSFNSTHSIVKRDAEPDDWTKALTSATSAFEITGTVSSAVPVVKMVFEVLTGVARLAQIFVSAIDAKNKTVTGQKLTKPEILKIMQNESDYYGRSIDSSFAIVRVALQNLNKDIEVVSKQLFFLNEYTILKQFFKNYVISKGGKVPKQDLLDAAVNSKIETILNGVQAYMLDQTYFTQAIIKSDYDGEAFGAWITEARTILYETVDQENLKKANNILSKMVEIGRKMYWENDVEKHVKNELQNWNTDGFDISDGINKAMKKYGKFEEKYVVIALSSQDVPPFTANWKHDVINIIEDRKRNLIIAAIDPQKGFQRIVVYIIRITENQLKLREIKKKIPAYVKNIGNEYGRYVSHRAIVRNAISGIDIRYAFQEDYGEMFRSLVDSVREKISKETNTYEGRCLFHLARFRFVEYPLNHLVVWRNHKNGFLSDLAYTPYAYEGKQYSIDTFALC